MKKTPNGRGGGLVIYVTSHGFGHLNRTAAVVNRVPLDVRVTIKSHSNLFKDWPERLTRPAELVAYVSDAGAVNPPGDSAATDGPRTLELASRCHAEAMARLDDEVARLREQGTAAVLCDAPAVPLVAARRAGVPGFLMSNFTWADIYAPHARAVGTAQATRLVAELRAAYRQAVATFRMEPAMSMSWLSALINVGMVVKRGRDRRAELCRLTGLDRKDKLVYLYLGRYGQSDLDWSRLERFAARGIHFLSYHPRFGGPARQPARDSGGGLARQRSHRLERCDPGQGRIRYDLRGDGLRHAHDLSASARICRVSVTRPRLTHVGRRIAGILSRLPRLETGASPGTGVPARSRASSVPGGRRGPDRRTRPAALSTITRSESLGRWVLIDGAVFPCKPRLDAGKMLPSRSTRGLSNHENRRLSRSRARSVHCSASGGTGSRLGERRQCG